MSTHSTIFWFHPNMPVLQKMLWRRSVATNCGVKESQLTDYLKQELIKESTVNCGCVISHIIIDII